MCIRDRYEALRVIFLLGIFIPWRWKELDIRFCCKGLFELKFADDIILGEDATLLPALMLFVVFIRFIFMLNCCEFALLGEGLGKIGTTDLDEDLLELEVLDEVLLLLEDLLKLGVTVFEL